MKEKIKELIEGYRRKEKRLQESAIRINDNGGDSIHLISAAELYGVVISDLERLL